MNAATATATATATSVFPEAISNTIREAFVQCPQKAYWAYFRRKVPSRISIHLHAGAAIAKAFEVTRRAFYENHVSSEESILLGYAALEQTYANFDVEHDMLDSNKSFANLSKAFMDYFMEYSLDSDLMKPHITADGKAALEFSFTIPMNILHPETGNPLMYAGKFDMLGERDGAFWVVDEKTTSALGASWSKQWDLNSQFTGYCFAAREYGFPVVGAIIRGIGLLKTKITHQQVILSRPQWQIDRWWAQLHRDVRLMVAMYEADKATSPPNLGTEFSFALGAACTSYGECPYKILCEAQNPEEWVPGYFTASDYNPIRLSESHEA